MRRAVIYLVFGLMASAGALSADRAGWLTRRPDVLRDVPRSIRDNPGAYRSLYNGSPRFFGGK